MTQEVIMDQVLLGHTVVAEAVAEVMELMEATIPIPLSHTVEKTGQTKLVLLVTQIMKSQN